MPTDRRSPAAGVLLSALSLAGAAIVLLATSHGPGIAPNSVIYLSAAEHVNAGQGLLALRQQGGVVPMSHYPPLFPLLMAAGGAAGIPIAETGRWLNALAFSASALLLGGLILRAGGSVARAAVGMVLFLTAVQSLEIHAYLLSEAPFTALLLGSYYALDTHLRSSRQGSLAIAAILMALAGLTRYGGAAFAAAGALGILLLAEGTLRSRWARAVVFGAASILPMTLWMVRNMVYAETAANRHVAFHAVTLGQLEKGAHTLAGWVGPTGMPAAFRALAALGVVAAGVLAWIGGRKLAESPERARVANLAALGIAAYLGLLFVSLSFVDAATPLTRRILSPVFTLGLILVLGALRTWFLPSRIARPAGAAAAILLAGITLFSGARAASWIGDARRTGLGFSSDRWRSSRLMAAVADLPPGLSLLTNAVEPVYYLARRVADELPARLDKYSHERSAGFDESLERIAGEVASGRAAVVWVAGLEREHLPDFDDLRARLGPPSLSVDGEGAIFR